MSLKHHQTVVAVGVRGFAIWLLGGLLGMGATAGAADAKPGAPATAQQAAQAIDLSALPRFGDAPTPRQARSSHLSYEAAGPVIKVFEFHQKQLTSKGWKEQPGGYATEQTATGTFFRNGFTISLTAMPAGDSTNISLINHGNVDLAKLPLPKGAKPLYAGPVSLMATAATAPADAFSELKAALEKQGWKPYGEAGDQHFFLQNAVRLGLSVSSAPAQAGQTMIMYSTEQLSAEIPAPPDALGLQYADLTHQLLFDTTQSEAEVIQFYTTTLAAGQWKPTLDKTIKIDFKDVVIYRNPQKELLELQMFPVEGKLRVQVGWQSAEEVAEEDRRAKAAAEKAAMQKSKPASKIEIALPAGSQKVEAAARSIDIKLATGTAKATLAAWKKDLEAAGWKSSGPVQEMPAPAGTFTLAKGDQELMIIYVDPGFIPAEVTITGQGGDLQVTPAR